MSHNLRWFRMKRVWLGLCATVLFSLLSSCSGTRMLMQQAPKKPKPSPQLPALTSPQDIKAKLEAEIFGPMPILSNTEIISKTLIAQDQFTESDSVTEWKITAGYGHKVRPLHIVLVMKEGQEKAPFIITQNFCPNPDVVVVEGLTPPKNVTFNCSGDGLLPRVFGYFFGRYIREHPYKMVLEKGYNIAVFYPSEFLPDSSEKAPKVMDELLGPDANRYGALAVWASLSNWLAPELKTTFGSNAIITYGHSRYGKTALLSAAYSDAVDGVISHQSGTGGASLLRDEKGESVADITKSYPHWFTSVFSDYASNEETLSVDAHSLLSLIAPRPLLLGNARRDVWSDPAGAFSAVQAANSAWQGKNSNGLTASRLDQFMPEDDIAFWLRPGTHGVVEEDWPAFLDFMDAHFKDSQL